MVPATAGVNDTAELATLRAMELADVLVEDAEEVEEELLSESSLLNWPMGSLVGGAGCA